MRKSAQARRWQWDYYDIMVSSKCQSLSGEFIQIFARRFRRVFYLRRSAGTSGRSKGAHSRWITPRCSFFILCVAAALVLCAVGGAIWRLDAFARLNHPLAAHFPNISRTFGIVMIVFSPVLGGRDALRDTSSALQIKNKGDASLKRLLFSFIPCWLCRNQKAAVPRSTSPRTLPSPCSRGRPYRRRTHRAVGGRRRRAYTSPRRTR